MNSKTLPTSRKPQLSQNVTTEEPGFHVALGKLGGRCVFAGEWDAGLRELYAENYGVRPWCDLAELNADVMVQQHVPGHDVLTAGFPCQPFSKAGSQQGFGDTKQRLLFFTVLRVLRVKKPRFLLLENVPNLLRHDDGRTLATITGALENLGYTVDVSTLSPHHFGVPQVRDRAYIVGALNSLEHFTWPAKSTKGTHVSSIVNRSAHPARPIPEHTMNAIDMWGDFLDRSPAHVKLPSFPIWSMEFGATYPYSGDTPSMVWSRNPKTGFQGTGVRGTFGAALDGAVPEQEALIPSHAGRKAGLVFPAWKQRYIRQNRDFHAANKSWIDPWLRAWQPQSVHSSFQKLEWNAQGERRDIDDFVLQVRASGIRVKRPTSTPALVASTCTQVPILGANIAGTRRYLTPGECANLQGLSGIALPGTDIAAYRALGNAVCVDVVEQIAGALMAGLTHQES